MSENGNGPDGLLLEEGMFWMDGFKQGFQRGFESGQSVGYDEATERFRIVVSNYHDDDLQEEFERIVG